MPRMVQPVGIGLAARGEVSDTLLGKRSALLDLRSPAGGATLHELLARADAVVCGYRPGALDLAEGAAARDHRVRRGSRHVRPHPRPVARSATGQSRALRHHAVDGASRSRIRERRPGRL